jgi:hypothetical protein
LNGALAAISDTRDGQERRHAETAEEIEERLRERRHKHHLLSDTESRGWGDGREGGVEEVELEGGCAGEERRDR